MIINSISSISAKHINNRNNIPDKKAPIYSSKFNNLSGDSLFISKTKSKKSQPYNCNFRGEPWKLTLFDEPIESYPIIIYDMAKTAYEKLAVGNYLDVIQESWDNSDTDVMNKRAKYERIRQNNLSFLDRMASNEEKELFVEYYKEITGFPYLHKTNFKVLSEAIKGAVKASKECTRRYYFPWTTFNIIRMGYNPVCSAGHQAALPGSDIDGLYIILNGSADPEQDIFAVEKFKGSLWNNTDQRFVSYNHPAAFPQIYTLSQIEVLLSHVNNVLPKMHLHKEISLPSSGQEESSARKYTTTLFKEYCKEKMIYDPKNYVRTNSFFINFNKYFPDCQEKIYFKEHDTYLNDYMHPTKEIMKNFGFFMEVYRNGYFIDKNTVVPYIFENFSHPNYFLNFHEILMDNDFSRLVNPLQIYAIKKQNQVKEKILKRRQEVNVNFNNLPIEEQYEYIKNIIKSSYSDGIESDNSPHRALLIKLGHERKNS